MANLPSIDGGPTQALAVEYKRPNEGLHGVLTALGQSHSYLEKGFDGALVVVPARYLSHANPGGYLDTVLGLRVLHCQSELGRTCTHTRARHHPFKAVSTSLDVSRTLGSWQGPEVCGVFWAFETQWAHVREGSVYPDHFFRYLQVARRISAGWSSGTCTPNHHPTWIAACSTEHRSKYGPDQLPVICVGQYPARRGLETLLV